MKKFLMLALRPEFQGWENFRAASFDRLLPLALHKIQTMKARPFQLGWRYLANCFGHIHSGEDGA
jgi:hypothetical protein